MIDEEEPTWPDLRLVDYWAEEGEEENSGLFRVWVDDLKGPTPWCTTYGEAREVAQDMLTRKHLRSLLGFYRGVVQL